jgi:hypothetical protein
MILRKEEERYGEGKGGWRTPEALRRIWVPHPCFSRVRVLTFLSPSPFAAKSSQYHTILLID